ncbi:hypothetical protein EVG20_g5847 [Dentipellis fragilis]|uniref:Uncharacterized protein n=1 Tax=Dentipellis fragilis TaxID=205917 RepID=A0A4Y9YSK3_9AGAM|nr:hypothetical protein EVG20_g5847 [Dentipellis fragilis]
MLGEWVASKTGMPRDFEEWDNRATRAQKLGETEREGKDEAEQRQSFWVRPTGMRGVGVATGVVQGATRAWTSETSLKNPRAAERAHFKKKKAEFSGKTQVKWKSWSACAPESANPAQRQESN